MNTNKAIDFLERLQNPHLEWLKKHNDDIDEIITLLMRGSAFEKMFREVENTYGSNLTWDIEQKYFPEEEVIK